MKKFNENKTPNYSALADDIRAFWDAEQIFEKSVSTREGQPTFTFYEGPPSANGKPGIHHVMARAVKDIFCRYKTMKGFKVERKGGWDTHGLPIELQVEKELGITKDDIGKKISIEEYNQKCRESVMRYTEEWNQLTKMMGYWVDLENPYVTYHNEYIETVWYILSELYRKDFLYKGYTIQPYSPAAGTGLSSHELNQPGTYKMVKDTSIVAQFKAVKNEASEVMFKHLKVGDELHFLAWTTTPWTLPANSALAVGKNINYVLVSSFNQYTFKPINVVLAKDLMGKYFSDKAKDIALEDYKSGDKVIPFKVLTEFKGHQLTGIKYEQLMPYVQPEGKAFEIIIGDFVSTEDGTGIVHISPTFGADDFRVAKQAGISAIMVKDDEGSEVPIVNKKGAFVAEITDFAGKYVKNYDEQDESAADYKSTDVLISIKLKEENKAFKVEKYEHSYPHCWRTDKPVLYYPMESWFIKTTAVKDRLIELNNTINWKPASTGSGRFGNWLENLVDWNLSRSRYWGIPLPVWRSEDNQQEICIGSIEQLLTEIKAANASGVLSAEQSAQNAEILSLYGTEGFDLHRPYIDRVWLVKEGKVMKRETDLIDVWFDSGSMPYAQWHWPFEKEQIFNSAFPADFIAEGVDQTRGWFFTLHAIAVMLKDSVAFKNVIANGLVLDKDGNKMSKRLGNAVDPFDAIQTYGPDPIRWYMIGNASPWENLKFNFDGVTEVQRKFFGTLANTWSFFAIYANMYNFNFSGAEITVSERPVIDKWVLSKLNSLVAEVTEAYETYEPTKGVRAITDFVCEDLSNWYVRLNRRRFWKGEFDDDKTAAFQTLYQCLETVSRLMAPVAPFYAERLFRDMNEVTERFSVESVHLAEFPKFSQDLAFEEIEERMWWVRQVVSRAHALRKAKGINVRQPLAEILIPVSEETLGGRDSTYVQLILSEVNVEKLGLLDGNSAEISRKIKPNFKELGKRYGADLKVLTPAISNLSSAEISQIESSGKLDLVVDGKTFIITTEDVLITVEGIDGWDVIAENGITVALDTRITEKLRKEGIAREVVSSIQNLRKLSGFDVLDKIVVKYQTNAELIAAAIEEHKNYIGTETQANNIASEAVVKEAADLALQEGEVSFQLSIA